MLRKLFGFDASRHSVRIEVMAGVTTFLAMSYILAVLIEGVIFIILTLTKMRMLIVKSIPESLKGCHQCGYGYSPSCSSAGT